MENKVVLITGGTRGIGFETARLFAKEKAQVILFGSKKETVEKAISKLQEEQLQVEGFYPDIKNAEEIKKVIAIIKEKYQRIDVLINNAGISANKKIDETSPEDFANIMEINVFAMFYFIKEVVPTMKAQQNGVILNTSSMVSLYGQSLGVGYPTSKFAVNGLTKSLARELAPYHIRVNAVAPGIINTDMVSNLPKEIIDPLVSQIPLGRIGTALDIANAFYFLASEKASYITGNILSVDGAARS